MKEITRSLGKFNLYCYATEGQIQEYLMGKYHEFLEENESYMYDINEEDDVHWPINIAVNSVGLQKIDPSDPTVQEINLAPATRVWVLNAKVQISEDGQVMDPTTTPFMWLGDLLKTTGAFAPYRYASIAKPVTPNAGVVRSLILAMQTSYVNNFPPALLTLGAQLLNLHYECMVLQVPDGIPVAVLYGDVECGKSRAMRAALSLMGTQQSHFIKRCPDMRFMTMTTQTTLGLVLDDPTDAKAISEKIMLLFDGNTMEQQSSSVCPRTTFMTSLNMPCFRKLATHHRLVWLYYCILAILHHDTAT